MIMQNSSASSSQRRRVRVGAAVVSAVFAAGVDDNMETSQIVS
jgi:hypothetical protein